MKRGPVRSLLGQVFDRLTVIEYSHKTSRGVHLWKCKCICGNTTIASTGNLEHNRKSCGCARKDVRIMHGVLSYDGLIRQLLGHYKQKAEQRDLSFTLTFDEFRALIFKNCYYCGAEPLQTYRPTRYVSHLKYNGVDRVDNVIGYEFSNCVTCCKLCNRAKSTLTEKEFFDLIEKIYRLRLEEVA